LGKEMVFALRGLGLRSFRAVESQKGAWALLK
jgi:hypothetical protein